MVGDIDTSDLYTTAYDALVLGLKPNHEIKDLVGMNLNHTGEKKNRVEDLQEVQRVRGLP